MSKDRITNKDQLITALSDIIEVSYGTGEQIFEIEDKIIDIKLHLPLEDSMRKNILSKNNMILRNYPNSTFNFHFKNCEFKKDIIIMDRRSIVNNEDLKDYTEEGSSTYEFSDCEFDNDEIILGSTKRNITFSGEGRFTKLLSLRNSKLMGKIRFRKCNFNKVDFS